MLALRPRVLERPRAHDTHLYAALDTQSLHHLRSRFEPRITSVASDDWSQRLNAQKLVVQDV